jgi:hypothetical protein
VFSVKLEAMSYLDNLEDNLKNLESREEGQEDAGRQQKARADERARAQAAAPWAEELKRGPYSAELLRQATLVGHALRTKVHIAWLGSTLRLEARGRRLELRPTVQGVVAVRIESGAEMPAEPVDLRGSPEALLRGWLESAG